MNAKNSPKQRPFYILAPLIFIIICLASLNLINWLSWQNDEATEAEQRPTLTAVIPATSTTQPPSQATNIPTQSPAASTVTPTSTATPYQPPSYSDEQTIRLLGPPANSIFSQEATISFYWQWPLPLSEDQFFAIYLNDGNETVLLGTVQEANIGNSYRLHVAAAQLRPAAVAWQWQVHLASHQTAEPLRLSEVRPFTLSSNP